MTSDSTGPVHHQDGAGRQSAARRSWPAAVLAAFASHDDLHVAPLRADGTTYGTPTWIWSVLVGGEVYVRAYNGTASRWYRSAVQQRSGRITVAGADHEADFTPVPLPGDGGGKGGGDDRAGHGTHNGAGQSTDDASDDGAAQLAGAVDEAYRARYAGSPYLDHMVGDRARAATVRLTPHSPPAAASQGASPKAPQEETA